MPRPSLLARYKREIGVLQELVGIDAVARRNGNADARADDHLMVTEIEGCAQRPLNSLGESGGFDGWVCHILDNGELVASQTGDRSAPL